MYKLVFFCYFSLHRVKNAIGVARAVLEYSSHSLIVGESATKFAIEMGFKEEDLHSNDSITTWDNWKKANCQPNFRRNVEPDPTTSCGPYTPKPLNSNIDYHTCKTLFLFLMFRYRCKSSMS